MDTTNRGLDDEDHLGRDLWRNALSQIDSPPRESSIIIIIIIIMVIIKASL